MQVTAFNNFTSNKFVNIGFLSIRMSNLFHNMSMLIVFSSI